MTLHQIPKPGGMIQFFGMAQLVDEDVLGDLWFNHQQPRIEADVPVNRTASPACSLNPHTCSSKTKTVTFTYSRKPWQQKLLPTQRQPVPKKTGPRKRIAKIPGELQRRGWGWI